MTMQDEIESLKRHLVMYKAAFRRLEQAVSLENHDAISSYCGPLVKISVIKEAMLLEPELFPIESRPPVRTPR